MNRKWRLMVKIRSELRSAPEGGTRLTHFCKFSRHLLHRRQPKGSSIVAIKRRLNTLRLAAKQLDAVERLDSDTILDVGDGDETFHGRLNELKLDSLRLEGSAHPDRRKALSALRRATEVNPENAVAFYCLGMFYAGARNKCAAVAALKRAIEFYPKSIEFRMELDRVKNLSPSEIASFRVTRAVNLAAHQRWPPIQSVRRAGKKTFRQR